MRKAFLLSTALLALEFAAQAQETAKAPGQGMDMPRDYKNFRLIGVSQRPDDQSLRAILGNEIAVQAARAGKTNPWPNGAILAKLVWKQKQSAQFPSATVPDAFSSAAFMIKDDVKYAETAGWGWGEWAGLDQKPYDKPGFAQECVACHSSVKSQDWVFTRPVDLP
jgi:hypothetical protein